MAQWTQGTVDLVNGSATVNGTGTDWLSSGATPGLATFNKQGSDVGYLVTGVADAQLTLETPWTGATGSGEAYVLNLELTSKGLVLIDETDVEFPAVWNHNMNTINGLLP